MRLILICLLALLFLSQAKEKKLRKQPEQPHILVAQDTVIPIEEYVKTPEFQAEAEDAYYLYDWNDDGTVTLRDFRRAMMDGEWIYAPDYEFETEWMRDVYDLNKDKIVSIEEFKNYYTEEALYDYESLVINEFDEEDTHYKSRKPKF